MSYRSLQDVVNDLEKHKQLVRVKSEVDPNLEMAEIHNRIFEMGGPAILFENVKGSPFRALSNIYGTFERTDFLFRHTIEKVKKSHRTKGGPFAIDEKPIEVFRSSFYGTHCTPYEELWQRGRAIRTNDHR